MSDSDELFRRATAEHLELRQRNHYLERIMPLDRYREEYERGLRAGATSSDDELPLSPRETSSPSGGDGNSDGSWMGVSEEKPDPSFDWESGG